ncbi:hypothetical protein A3C26_02025 [Candidatus Daviesbacteria bacterium RIFCSPHIGHO2_02_FULL_39_12]|uniref:Uncharacterized protein n=1 Tax=Candidatus Daviesbacteria bacterium RIFCSPHIGHO2_02_FULL_39_12 TaxID=1797770 RepID=A0A1F5J8Z2_9BACT|nr:MAG: hypothetical protein A3C26_02025 [Candidatus Daviesbacteria bacterium RIFCSPHIGHO2_02_FULL_39_12]
MQEIFSCASIRNYDIDPDSLELTGLALLSFLRVQFDRDTNHRFLVVFGFANDLGEESRSCYAWQEAGKTKS